MKKLNVAIIGQGRSGMGIHGAFFLSDDNNLCNVVAVVDEIKDRRERAKEAFKCDVYSDYRELFGRTDIDFVINATFSHLHYPITMDLLRHKFNVVVEKPFARYARECDDMIAAAKENNVMLAVFQQSRFAPYYKRIKEIIASNVLGDLVQISIAFSGFSRRYDWQCSQRFYGGNLLNTGPHPMDQALDLMQYESLPQVFSKMARVNTAGDAEDYVKIVMTAPGKPLVDVEISSCDKYSDYLYKIQGTNGTLKASMTEIEYQYIIPEHEIKHELILNPLKNEDGTPAYCVDKPTWHEKKEIVEKGAFSIAVNEFYQSIYNHLVDGKPLIITPEQVRKQIAIAEQVHYQNPLSILY